MAVKITNEFPGIPGDSNEHWGQVSIEERNTGLGLFLQQDKNKLQIFSVGLDSNGKYDGKGVGHVITITIEQFAEAWLSMIEDGRKKGVIK